MNNKTRFLSIIGIIIAVLTLLYFIIPYPHHNITVFVITYIFLLLVLLSQIYVFHISFVKRKELKSKVYGIPVAKVGLIYLIITIIYTLAICIINAFVNVPTYIGIIVPVLILALYAIGFITITGIKETIEKQEIVVESKTAFIDSLKIECQDLVNRYENTIYSKGLNKLLEEVKYSDPVSNEKNIEIENKINNSIQVLKEKIISSDSSVLEIINEIIILVKERTNI